VVGVHRRDPHARSGGPWSQIIDPRRMLANSDRGTATSASWDTTQRPWRTILAPIFKPLVAQRLSDQCSIFYGASDGRSWLRASDQGGQSVTALPW